MNLVAGASPGAKGEGRWRLLFLAAVVAGWLALALLPPRLTAKFGLGDNGVWFLDTYSILATGEAVQAGMDPSQPNPLDVYGRPHSYSSWWFVTGKLGLTRAHNPAVGGVVVGLFAVALACYLKPRTGRQALAALLAVLSPVALLAFNRANNDLVVLALLLAGLAALGRDTPLRAILYSLAVVLATGLKFYPVLAGAALLALGPSRWRGWLLAGTGLACVAVLASQWEWFRRAVIPVSDGVYLFGAGLWWREFGITGWSPVALTLVLVGLGARWLVARGWCHGLGGSDGSPGDRAGFVAGAVLLTGCWFAGISFAYRWVFGLLLLPWLWRLGSDRSARVTGLLLLICLWLDGLFCLGTNLLIGPMPLDRLRGLQHGFQLATQPLVAALMLLLAGWLVHLLQVRAGEWLQGRLRPWRATPGWFLLFLVLGWMIYVQSDRLRPAVGLANSETWFLDSYAVLAASDAHRAGFDAAVDGHLDPLGRPHRYSDWWYLLGPLGFTREDNFLFGALCVVAAVAALAATVRPRSWPLIGWSLLVLLSPGVFLGLNRANNDLVVFALLGLALALLRADRPWRHALAAVAVALAAGLKFYPVVVALPLFWHHARAGRTKTAWASAALVGAALLSVWPQMARGRFPVEVSVHVWGAGIWPQDLGLGSGFMAALLAIGFGAALFVARRQPGAVSPAADDELPMMVASTLLLACFVAGMNYGYRWTFAIWLGPWLLRASGADMAPGPLRLAARAAWILVPLVLWLDGLLCLAFNYGGLAVAGLDQAGLQHAWRLLTQPVHWLLMLALACLLAAGLWPKPGRTRAA